MTKQFDEKILVAQGIVKSYHDGENQLQVLADVNLEVGAGEQVVVSGASGSGKSTLLHVIAGLTKLDQGTVFVSGKSIHDASAADCASIRRKHCGFVYQQHHLLPDFNAGENVLIPCLIGGMDRRSARKRAEELLDFVGLSDRYKHRPFKLSGGERQRVALCRAVATNPVLVLADEPTGNLDQASAQRTLELMTKLCEEEQTAFLVVTHDSVVAEWGTRSLVLKSGVLVTE